MLRNFLSKIVVAALVCFGFSTQLSAQENTRRNDYKSFQIYIKVEADTIRLNCQEGCNWDSLSFVKPYDLNGQAINQFGLTKIDNLHLLKDDDGLADFLFVISQRNAELTLAGRKGVYWKSLTVPCPDEACEMYFDEVGAMNNEDLPAD